MFGVPFYHGTIRNTIIAFGRLFSNIVFERMNNGVVEQTIRVPIAYSQKEKWVQSIEQNPDGERGIYTTLPRLAFEITGYSYDSARKLPRMGQVSCISATSGYSGVSGYSGYSGDLNNDIRKQVFTPVPWNIDLGLYFATKTQEDGLQILEQILPTFAPEYTIAIRSIPSLNIIQDVPFILNSVNVQDDYEGDLETRRFVIHSLSFTAKVNLFGRVSDQGVINTTEIGVEFVPDVTAATYTATQEKVDDPITENWLANF